MAKHGKRRPGSQARLEKSVTVQMPLPVLGPLTDTREAFHERCIRTASRCCGR